MISLEELIQAAMAAPPHLKEDALRVLRGEAQLVDSPQPAAPEPYLTLKELAQRLGLSVPTLWRWQVPGNDLGGRRRYRLSDVQAYLKSENFKRRTAALRAERREKISKTIAEKPQAIRL